MTNHSHRTPDRSASAPTDGFTLTELLVVVSILGLLMGILIPSVQEAVVMAQRRAGCAGQLNAIVKAANQYALSDRQQALPTVAPDISTWGHMVTGNPGCLWLLIADRSCDRTAFRCPEAQSYRGWTAPPQDAGSFTYSATTTISTLSYSYTSMVRYASWTEKLAEKMTMSTVPGTLVVLADKNPRTTFGTTKLDSYAAINAASNNTLGESAKCSVNHRRKGQNFARWDASVKWATDPNDPNGNDYYSSSVKSATDEKRGRRSCMEDPFLLP